MTRRVWQWMLGAVLAGALPACAHLGLGVRPDRTPPTKATTREPARPGPGGEESEPADHRAASLASGPSPYHPLRQLEPPAPPGPVRQTAFPEVEMPRPPEPPRSPESPQPAVEVSVPPELPRAPMAAPEPDEDLVKAIVCMLRKRDSEAVGHLKRYEPSTQEVFIRVMALIADLNEKSLEQMSTEEVANLQEQLQNLLATVRSRAALSVETVCLCGQVKGYRSYTPKPRGYQFLPTSGNRPGEVALLYAELRNLGSIKRGAHYETRLSAAVSLHDESRQQVYYKVLQEGNRPQFTPTPRADLFQTYEFYVPAVPRPGKYYLTLTVRDETSRPPREVTSQPVEMIIAGPE